MRARPPIESPEVAGRSAVVRLCRDVAAGRGPAGLVLLEGDHLIEDALSSGVEIDVLLSVDAAHPLVQRARDRGARTLQVGAAGLASASPVRSPSGRVALARWSPLSLDRLFETPAGLIVGLVDVQDPGNVGSAIRSADALGAVGIATLGQTANPGAWKVLRATMGSAFRIPVASGTVSEATSAARLRRLSVAASVAEGGQAIQSVDWTRPRLLLLGNEGAGLPREIIQAADERLTIPMQDSVNSLNVSAAAAVMLWEARRDRLGSQQP